MLFAEGSLKKERKGRKPHLNPNPQGDSWWQPRSSLALALAPDQHSHPRSRRNSVRSGFRLPDRLLLSLFQLDGSLRRVLGELVLCCSLAKVAPGLVRVYCALAKCRSCL